MKDTFYIYDSNDNKLEMEAVLKFNIDGYSGNYLIYKNKNEEYFVAKYIGDEIVDLITDLTDIEINFCEKALERYLKNEVKS